jgi:hypothetical protein
MAVNKASVPYPSLYQINTRVWLTELSRTLGRSAALDDILLVPGRCLGTYWVEATPRSFHDGRQSLPGGRAWALPRYKNSRFSSCAQALPGHTLYRRGSAWVREAKEIGEEHRLCHHHTILPCTKSTLGSG